jgi:hypothetical protein
METLQKARRGQDNFLMVCYRKKKKKIYIYKMNLNNNLTIENGMGLINRNNNYAIENDMGLINHHSNLGNYNPSLQQAAPMTPNQETLRRLAIDFYQRNCAATNNQVFSANFLISNERHTLNYTSCIRFVCYGKSRFEQPIFHRLASRVHSSSRQKSHYGAITQSTLAL